MSQTEKVHLHKYGLLFENTSAQYKTTNNSFQMSFQHAVSQELIGRKNRKVYFNK
jgi:hypothetical protein